jgi:Patched family
VTIGVAVLLVISVIIFNPWAAAMVAIIVVSMTVELAGFMGLFGVKMNPISAVTLVRSLLQTGSMAKTDFFCSDHRCGDWS